MLGVGSENDKVFTTNSARWTPKGWKVVDGIGEAEVESTFDFEILKKQSYAYDPETGEAREIPGHYHLERSTDGGFIPCASVGVQFTPVQHKAWYEKVRDEIMPEMPDAKLEMVATFHGGGTGIIALKMGDSYQIKGDQSEQITRLLITNPSNGTGKITLGYTNVRIVCQNTLMAAIDQSSNNGWTIKHTKNVESRANGAIAQIKKSVQAAIEMRERMKLLANIGCGSSMLATALDAVYSLYGLEEGSPAYNHLLAKRQDVVREFESGETAQSMTGNKSAWTLFNAFTFPIFNPTKISTKTDYSQIQYQGMVGTTAKEVRDIFETVTDIAVGAA